MTRPGTAHGLDRVVLATGGTGGHVFPALAVAEELRARHPDTTILFVGGERGPEGDMARRAGLEFVSLPASGVVGVGLGALAAPAWIARSLARCIRIYRAFRPDAVIGFGGYAGFVPVLAGVLLRVVSAVHEQNSVPGMVNRVLARFVDRVFISFTDMGPDTGSDREPGKGARPRSVFPRRKTVLVGNPVRKAIRDLGREPARDSSSGSGRNVLVAGGSQGARGVNEAVLAAAERLAQAGVRVLHQTGQRDYDRLKDAYQAKGLLREGGEGGAGTVRVEPFIGDMAAAYRWADLVVCRSGATTLAEVAVAGKPCLFIPFPYATHGHQSGNARSAARAGAALVIEERDLPATDLAGLVTGLLDDPARLARMAEAAKRLGRPNAAADLVTEMERLVAARSTGRTAASE